MADSTNSHLSNFQAVNFHMETAHSKRLAFFVLVITSLIWGATGAIMKLTLEVIPVFLLAFLRFSIASLILFPFVRKNLHIQKQHIFSLILSGVLGISFNIAFFFLGLKLTTALNSGILLASTPIFTLTFAHFLLKEKMRINFILGSILGILGIITIISRDVLQHGFGGSPLGDVLILFSVLSFVGYETIAKKLFKVYNPFVITFYLFLIGSVTFLPFAILQNLLDLSWVNKLSFPVAAGILYGIFASSLTAYSLWDWGLSKLSESKVGFFLYLDPISSTIAAVILLSERINPFFILGSVFIFAGLLFAEFHFNLGLFLGKKKMNIKSEYLTNENTGVVGNDFQSDLTSLSLIEAENKTGSK